MNTLSFLRPAVRFYRPVVRRISRSISIRQKPISSVNNQRAQGGMDPTQFREASHAAVEDIINYFTNISDRPVTARIAPGYLRPLLPSTPPQDPEQWPAISSDIESKIMTGLTHWQHPNFMAFFPSTVTYPSILGEMYSAAFNAPAFNWLCSPACTELETIIMDWLAKMLGLPEVFLSDGSTGGGGVIQGSASEAILTCIIAARERYIRKVLSSEGLEETPDETESQRIHREDRSAALTSRMVILASEQSHSSGQKAANILGLRFRSVKAGRDTMYKVTGANLRAKIEECKKNGLEPFFMHATIGTTSLCAVDELGEIAEVKKDYPDLWLHIDAAYAGAALICEEYRALAKHEFIGEYDSFNFNMHKWLLVNFDASILHIRDRTSLTAALSITPSYLTNPSAISGLVTDYRDWQIPLGRRFRALKIWFVIRSYGVSGMQKFIRHTVKLGELMEGLVRGRGDLFEVVDEARFGLVVLRCLPKNTSGGESNGVNGHDDTNGTNGANTGTTNGPTKNPQTELNNFGTKTPQVDTTAANALTKKIYETINARGEIFLTSSVVDGWYIIRIVSANERAEEKYIRRAFEILCETAEELR